MEASFSITNSRMMEVKLGSLQIIREGLVEMDESGFGAQVAAGILILVLLISAIIVVYSFKSVREQLMSAWQDKGDRISDTAQTDITIENAKYDNTDDNLRVITKNTGSTVLDVSQVNLVVPDNVTTFTGSVVPEDNIKTKTINGENTDVWIPEKDLVIVTDDNIIENVPQRIKIVTEYGVSDYFTNISEV